VFSTAPRFSGLPSVVGQVMVLDIVFWLDSVITAVGMAEHIEVMVTAVVIAIGVMLLFAKQIGDFVRLLNIRFRAKQQAA
jgi:predicted tellurium resistance membrane protein TerC